jgi:hypothetical protein
MLRPPGPFALVPHPTAPCEAVTSLEAAVAIRWRQRWLQVAYRLTADLAGLVIPAPAAPARRDELWKQTCFEAFIGGDEGGPYLELNLSPSRAWAAYRFAAYRSGMTQLDLPRPPSIDVHSIPGGLMLESEIELGGVMNDAQPPRLALSAIIESADGRQSYWALAHPPGRPDFHHAAGFVLALPETA